MSSIPVSPFFDQGLCLLADTRQDYPYGIVYRAMHGQNRGKAI